MIGPRCLLPMLMAGGWWWGSQLLAVAQPADFNYTTPVESVRLFDADKLSVSGEERELCATLLVTAAKLTAARPYASHDQRLIGKCMALAMELTPGAKAVTVANFQFSKNVTPPVPDDAPTLKQISASLCRQAEALSASDGADNRLLAGYLFETAALLDPLNEDAVFQMSTAVRGGFRPAWHDKLAKRADAQPAAPAVSERASIKILLVSSSASGQDVGLVNNLIGVMLFSSTDAPRPYSYTGAASAYTTGNLRLTFSGSVGSQMSTAAWEAARLVTLNHPNLSPRAVQLSFEDKYTPKDGGSSGAATAVLLLSLLDKFELDHRGVITGDITVDGLVQKIGGVFAKTEGAIASGAKFMVLPAQNTGDLDDYFVMHPIGDASKIQVFSAENIDEALALMKSAKPENLARAMELFDTLPLSKTGDERARKLREITRLAPNHLSAQILQRHAAGALPRKMSVPNSIDQIFSAAAPLLPWLARNSTYSDTLPVYPPEVSGRCAEQLNALNFKVDPRTAGLQDAFLTYIHELKILTSSGKGRDLRGNATYNPRFQPVLEARARIYAEISALQYDKRVLESYLRKDPDYNYNRRVERQD